MKRVNKRRLVSAGLTILSCIGTALTGYFAHINTKKAIRKMEEEGFDPSNWKEEFKFTWKCYIPTYVSGILTIACIGFNDKHNQKYIVRLISAGGFSAGLIREYEMKAREMIGDEQVELIKKAVAEDHLNDIQIAHPPVITTPGLVSVFDDIPEEGDAIFYDEFFEHSWRTSKEAMRAGCYYFNRNYAMGGYSTAEELYNFWGVEHPTLDLSMYAWSCEFMLTWYGASWIDINFVESTRKVKLKDGSTIDEVYYRIVYPIQPMLEEFAAADIGSVKDFDKAIETTQSTLLKQINN